MLTTNNSESSESKKNSFYQKILGFFKIKSHSSVALLLFHLVFFIILAVNFPFGKFFTGWDNIHPEFDFFINFRRSIFAMWQENYGLGTLGGHGFAALLPHNIIIYLMSFVLPIEALRPTFTLIIYYLGGIGVVVLTRLLLQSITKEKRMEAIEPFLDYIAIFAGLFYMLNLGTIQMFNTQLETFIANYAALPWLFWIVIKALQNTNQKNLFLFVVINFFATLQGFIPSLFVAYALALGIFLLTYFLSHKRSFESFKKIFLIILLTAVTNAYWLIPVAYYTKEFSDIYPKSNLNLKLTQEFIDRNEKYGTIQHVPLIKGFIFDTTEAPNTSEHIYGAWVPYQAHNFIPLIGYLFFSIITVGVIYAAIRIKEWKIRGFIGVFFLYFTGITTNFPPFSYLTYILQNYVPIYRDAFRTPFTKFAFGVSFSYSLFIGIGILFLLYFCHVFISKKVKSTFLIIILSTAFLLIYAFPVFRGNLFAKKLITNYPTPYFELFDYLRDKGDGKIADFPQDMFTGWYHYTWGYSGSGFLWFGIRQPILSRTFDVWTDKTENYYWEITQAIREQNSEKFNSVINKYNVRWILYDFNIIHPSSPKGFKHVEAMLDYLNTSPNYKLVKKFDDSAIQPILLYESTQFNEKSNIRISKNVSNIGPEYKWNDNDPAYNELHTYRTNQNDPFAIYYPFRSLFTKRESSEKEFEMEAKQDKFIFRNKLPKNILGYELRMKPLGEIDPYTPIQLMIQQERPNVYILSIQYLLPEIYIDKKKISYTNDSIIRIGQFAPPSTGEIQLFLNGEPLKMSSKRNTYNGVLYKTLANTLQLLTDENEEIGTYDLSSLPSYQELQASGKVIKLPQFKEGIFEVVTPKITNDQYHEVLRFDSLDDTLPAPCFSLSPGENTYETGTENNRKYIRIISQDTRHCISLLLDTVQSRYGYVIEVRNRHISGRTPQLIVANNRGVHLLNTFLEPSEDWQSEYFVIPPAFQDDIGYYATISNISHNSNPTVNDFGGVGMWSIPYSFLTSLTLTNPDADTISPSEQADLSYNVNHPNETFYKVTINENATQNDYLILSESFDKGWTAYYLEKDTFMSRLFPFIFGKKLDNHVVINNWANGWQLSNSPSQTVVVIFWPQYLQFLGFAMLILLILSYPTIPISRRNQYQKFV